MPVQAACRHDIGRRTAGKIIWSGLLSEEKISSIGDCSGPLHLLKIEQIAD